VNIADKTFRLPDPITLPEDEVHLWRIDLEAASAFESRWQQVLSADERARGTRFHFARDRQSFVTTRALLRTILAAYLSIDPRDLTFLLSKKDKPVLGKPYSDNRVAFNISHSGTVALLAFTRGRDVGVDVELLRQDFDVEAIARRFFSENEQQQLTDLPTQERHQAFFRCWTRKEAYVKATGDGLSLPLHQFDVSIVSGDTNALLATRPDASEARLWAIRDVEAGSNYAAALCVHGHEWRLKNWKLPG
jgi:4'-phosphopantetheinyl transferase